MTHAGTAVWPRPDQLAGWRRVRRHAVPRWMIEESARCRAAGDWRGACAAAGMDVTFDLDEVRAEHGAQVAERLEDDLRHLVPDLVRWHAPRVLPGRTTLTPGTAIVLATYGLRAPGPRLHVTTHPWLLHGAQRLSLNFAPVQLRDDPHICTDYTHTSFWRNIVHSWAEARHLWDDRHTDELRERCGGDAERAPFLEPDGTPREPKALPGEDPGPGDPAARTEWVTTLYERGEVEEAFAAAGIELVPPGPESERFREFYTIGPIGQLARMPLNLTVLEQEMRRPGGDRLHIPWTQHASVLFEHDGERGLKAAVLEYDSYYEAQEEELSGVAVLAEAVWRRPPDLDLLRRGTVPAEWLHPLVRGALMPARAPAASSRGSRPPEGPPEPVVVPVRVRCRDAWHEVVFDGGVMRIPHTAEEQEREAALEALGGDVGGCFAVRKAWRTGEGRLPRVLRELRSDIFDRARHGDTPGVLRVLDQGVDPHVRDHNRRTLLHYLHLLDHEPLLPRLLDAGLHVDAADNLGRSALHWAVEFDGPVELVTALLDAGAAIDLLDDEEITVDRLIDRAGRHDLDFLRERIEREHPDLLEY